MSTTTRAELRDMVIHLASWRHAHLCGTETFRGPKRPPEHSWRTCKKMQRFHGVISIEDYESIKEPAP